jgi:hypothetical protein
MITLNPLPAEAREAAVCALGHAIAKIWSQLPHDIQHRLFEDAVALQGEAARHYLAILLHDLNPRTCDTLKARAMMEPDSLGG